MPFEAKLFKNGGSQAVRLPKECRFENVDVVYARREGKRVILEPKDEWSESFWACFGAWDEHIERPEAFLPSGLRDPFD